MKVLVDTSETLDPHAGGREMPTAVLAEQRSR